MTRLFPLLLCVLAAGLMACSDDDNDKDSGVTVDQKVADQKVADQKIADQKIADQKIADQKVVPDKKTTIDFAGVDKSSGGDMSVAEAVRADTVAFVTALTANLPSTAPSSKVETYVLKDNAVKGWIEDVSMGKGVQSGYDKKAIEGIINGSHDPYDKEGCKGFAKQDYKKGTFTLVLFLWQMNTAAGAKKMFDKNKKDGEDNAGITFKVIPGVKDAAIIGDDKPQWKAYAHKGPYVFKIYASYM